MNISDRIDKKHRKEYERNVKMKFPIKNMQIELTNICNHKCIFCANQKMNRKKGYIDEDFLYRILQEAYNEGMREVGYYTTGEPFMSKKLYEYIKKAKDIGYEYVYITTNGAMADIENIKRCIESGLDSIKFSINASDRNMYKFIHGKDDFDIVIKNLKDLYDYRKVNNSDIKIFVSTIQTRYSMNNEDELKLLLKSYVDEIIFLDVRNQGGYMPEINELLIKDTNIENKKKCNLPFNSIHITYEGYLNACCVDFENQLAIADLRNLSLKEAWNCDTFMKLRDKFINDDIDDILCGNCMKGLKNIVNAINTELSENIGLDKFYDCRIVNNRIEEYLR